MTGVRVLPHHPAELRAIHARHHPVAHDDAHVSQLEALQALVAVGCRQHRVGATEVVRNEVAHVIVVVHDQHDGFGLLCGSLFHDLHIAGGETDGCFLLYGRRRLFLFRHGHVLFHRQCHGEDRPLARRRCHLHLAMMSHGEHLHGVQSDARARLVVLGLIESVEDTTLVLLADADAVVGDTQLECAVGDVAAGHADVALGIFARIGHEVAENLSHGLSVDDRREAVIGIADVERDVPLRQCGLEPHSHGPHELCDVADGEVQAHALLFHLVVVEQLIDEVEQAVCVAVDDVDGLCDGLSARRTAAGVLLPRSQHLLLQILERSDDERHGSAYLVGNHGEEP